MDAIPTEITTHISSFLSPRDLKSFRLCCKAFAEIGQSKLFSDFDFRLWPSSRRLYQLGQLSEHPEIASRLKCLCFESGVPLEYADYRYWQANVYKDLSNEWAMNQLAAGRTPDTDYDKFHNKLQARFTPDMANRYKLYRCHLDAEAATIAWSSTNTLAGSIAVLKKQNPALKFKMVMSEPRITLEELEAFNASQYQLTYDDSDPRRTVTKRREHVLQHFVNFLRSSQFSDFEVDDLTAINIPSEMFTDDRASETCNKAFQHLRALDMKIGALPHSDWLSRSGLQVIYSHGRNPAARRLRGFLDKASSLEHLRLEFPGMKEAEYSFELLDTTNLDRFPRLFLPHLKSFELSRFRCSWQDLLVFLLEAVSLSKLKLSYCRLEAGSMIDLLHFIPQMKLQSASLHGVWYVDDDCGEWHAHTADDFTADCVATTSYEGPYMTNGMKTQIERFMTEGGESPLPQWTPHGREEDIWEMKGDTSWHYIPGPPQSRHH